MKQSTQNKSSGTAMNSAVNDLIENRNIWQQRLRFAVMYCDVQRVQNLVSASLEHEGIENIESYHENTIITFEFIFNLLKLCSQRENHSNVKKYLLYLLTLIVDYYRKLRHSDINLGDFISNQFSRVIENHDHDCVHTCIIFKHKIKRNNHYNKLDSKCVEDNTSTCVEWYYCCICDYFFCQKRYTIQVE